MEEMSNLSTKYAGEYIAFSNFNSKRVIAHDKDLGKVVEKARSKGIETPVIVFVRDPNVIYIPSVWTSSFGAHISS